MSDRSSQDSLRSAINHKSPVGSAWTRREGRIGLAVALIALLGSLTIYFALISPDDQPEIVRVLYELEIASAEELYPVALQEAADWNSEAQLIRIDLDVYPIQLYFFTFNAPPDETMTMSVQITPHDSGQVVETKHFQSPSEASQQPISTSAWEIDSDEAFEIARSAGVEEFLLKHSSATERWGIKLWHWPSIESKLAWLVFFSGIRGPSWDAFIDPISGEIIKIEESGPVPLPEF